MTPQTLPDHYDVLIVGARCAGAATAMLLARAGWRVLAIDRAAPDSDTMSTHALMRGAVMQLDRWGVLPGLMAAGTPPICQTTFHYGDQSHRLDITSSFGVDHLIAPRRSLLDGHLVMAARTAGADIRHRTGLVDLVRDDTTGRVTGAVLSAPSGKQYRVSANIVIGADGRRSTVARQVGAETLSTSLHRTTCIYAYCDGLQDDGYRWYYDIGATAGAVPTNDGAHCVFASVDEAEYLALRGSAAPQTLLRRLAGWASRDLAAELTGARLIDRPITFAGAYGHIRQSHGLGWALVGDASYFKDPATAHGITDALRDAEILARALIKGGEAALESYQTQRDALSDDLFQLTDQIASLTWTLPELQELHMQLNQTMKAEQIWMQEAFAPLANAA